MNELVEHGFEGQVICHLTSVHSRYDTRIFLKECRTLASANYSTHLVVADGKGDETRDGVRIIDAGASVDVLTVCATLRVEFLKGIGCQCKNLPLT